ncbi:MAG: hypothetical protein HUJ31_11690, partial [Pseudomonadales bacterium]|nr:hypothetical protein [Pseudomonadales bacterium]
MSEETLMDTVRRLRSFVQKREPDDSLLLRILETEIEVLALELTVARGVKGADEIL